MPSTYSRRSRTANTDEQNGRRSQRRRRDESEEQEEVVDQSRHKRRQHESNGHSSRNKGRSRQVVEEEEEVEEEGGDDDNVQVVDDYDHDEGEEQDGEADGGLWGIQPLTKLKASKTALKAAEQVGTEVSKVAVCWLVHLASESVIFFRLWPDRR